MNNVSLFPVDNMTVQTIAICLATVFSCVNAVFAAFMWRMRATFVPRPEIEKAFDEIRGETGDKFERIERQIEIMDVRMRAVEANAAGAAAEIRGVRDIVSRVERHVLLQLEFQLQKGQAK